MRVHMGIESGNDAVRNKVLKRNMNNKQIIRSFKLCDKYGIKTLSFNMIGIPHETEKNIQETIKLNRVVNPHIVGVSIFRPYPGTRLYDLCKKKKWISKRKVNSIYENSSILDLPSISNKKIKYYHDVFRWLVFRPSFLYYPIVLLAKINIRNKSVYRIIFPFIRKTYFSLYKLIKRFII